MQEDRRREIRGPNRKSFSISWQDTEGITRSGDAHGLNSAHSGLAFHYDEDLPVGTSVYIQADDGCTTGYTVVRHCRAEGGGYIIGVELDEAAKRSSAADSLQSLNYYELLQISPNAQASTIQRIYRYLAARYHPDNPDTGDPERFLILTRAYKALSDPERRAAYDAELQRGRKGPDPEFEGVDFLDGVDGELNRRLAVLAVLYRRCRANINDARISLLQLEAQMGFPREYLDFTTWYLRSKKFITKEDNSDFSLTVLGVDFVEANYDKLPLLRKLLNSGPSPVTGKPSDSDSGMAAHLTERFFLLGNDDSEESESTQAELPATDR